MDLLDLNENTLMYEGDEFDDENILRLPKETEINELITNKSDYDSSDEWTTVKLKEISPLPLNNVESVPVVNKSLITSENSLKRASSSSSSVSSEDSKSKSNSELSGKKRRLSENWSESDSEINDNIKRNW